MKRSLAVLGATVAAIVAGPAITASKAEAMTAGTAAQALAGNVNYPYAADDDLTAEWYHYEFQGWTITTMDFSTATPPPGHTVDWWAYYKTKNGTLLWTKFRVKDGAVTTDNYWHDYVLQRAR